MNPRIARQRGALSASDSERCERESLLLVACDERKEPDAASMLRLSGACQWSSSWMCPRIPMRSFMSLTAARRVSTMTVQMNRQNYSLFPTAPLPFEFVSHFVFGGLAAHYKTPLVLNVERPVRLPYCLLARANDAERASEM